MVTSLEMLPSLPVILCSKANKIFLGCVDPVNNVLSIMKTNNSLGYLPNVSAKSKTLVLVRVRTHRSRCCGGFGIWPSVIKIPKLNKIFVGYFDFTIGCLV